MAETKSSRSKKPITSLAKFYLIAYNMIETIGWSYILFKMVCYYQFPKEGPQQNQTLYDSVKCALIIFQNAAILEVVHAAIRIVPSSPVVTAMQVTSRVVIVCGVLISTNAARQGPGLVLCLIAWSVTEIIRYATYALNLMGAVPHFLIWLRYSTFIILYPIGITGELLCAYAAQQEVASTKIYTVLMPNPINFVFDYRQFLVFFMLLYIPIFPKLYMHMFSQRKKVLGGGSRPANKKST